MLSRNLKTQKIPQLWYVGNCHKSARDFEYPLQRQMPNCAPEICGVAIFESFVRIIIKVIMIEDWELDRGHSWQNTQRQWYLNIMRSNKNTRANVLPAPSEIEFPPYIGLIVLLPLCDSPCVHKRCSRSCVYGVESAQHPGDETYVFEDYGESK